MLDEVGKQKSDAIFHRVEVVVGHPVHVGMVRGIVAPVGSLTDNGVGM
jgi:hypothetical protein